MMAFTLISSIYILLSSLIHEASGLTDTSQQSFRRRAFLKDEFHYLNMPLVGSVTTYDDFDCTLACLRNPSCLSVNMAASVGSNENLWCELLSSDKYSSAHEYKANKSSHHFAIESPCSSMPCQNGGTCVSSYTDDTFKCRCDISFIGEFCEKAFTSCKEVFDFHNSDVSQLITLLLDSKPTSVLCQFGDFGCGDGGWTPVMKIDGNKNTFHYDSGFWNDTEEYNLPGGETGFDTQETKLPSYWNTSFTKVCLGMKIGNQINFIVINKQANSLYSLIADGQYRATSLGRDTWKTLIGSQASLQLYCNKEGFNTASELDYMGKVRIGFLANNENDCHGCDSRIGFGTGGDFDDSNTCGNEASWYGDNGDKHIKAMGYILVN